MKGSLALELLFLLGPLTAILAFLLDPTFSQVMERSEKAGSATTLNTVLEEMDAAFGYLLSSPIGSHITIHVHLPRYTSFECDVGSSSLRIRVWDVEKNHPLPLTCSSRFELDGPFRGTLRLWRTGEQEVNIG